MHRVNRAGVRWLVGAAADRDDCGSLWRDNPRTPYSLPTGTRFDALVVEQELGLETFNQLRRRRLPDGPVLADWAARQIGFVLPPASRDVFARVLAEQTSTSPVYRHLGAGCVVVVPGPFTLAGDRYEWLSAPVDEAGPTAERTRAVAVMLAASAELIARAQHFGEVRLHDAG